MNIPIVLHETDKLTGWERPLYKWRDKQSSFRKQWPTNQRTRVVLEPSSGSMSDLIFVRPIFVFIRGRFGPHASYHPSCSSKYSKAILFHSGDFFFVFRVDDLSWFELNNDEDDSLEFFDRLRKFAQCFLTTTSVRDNRFYCLRIRSSSFNCMPTRF